MALIGGTPDEIEARAETARRKYGAMTINEILSRIIILTLIGYLVITLAVIGLYISPISERLLTSVLLVFVLVEMLTEYALWAFTYQGMRKTEGPIQDLQKFSSITKEGWKRAELVFKLSSPFFKWLEDTSKRMGFGYEAAAEPSPAPTTPANDAAIRELAKAVRELSLKIEEQEKRSQEASNK